ncbi:MAG: S8 family peptidase [Planctomycetaceae bacterium]|nr:S8 family peptidase [Planctomycetaceae bacterium]
MSADRNFDHIRFVARIRDSARLNPPPRLNNQTRQNRANHAAHAEKLSDAGRQYMQELALALPARPDSPVKPVGVPVLLKLDPNQSVAPLAEKFEFDVVTEQEDGVVVFCSSDGLTQFLEQVDAFATNERGSAVVASVHEFIVDGSQQERLKRILSERLLELWPSLSQCPALTVDLGVSCESPSDLPARPRERPTVSPTELEEELESWMKTRRELLMQWEELKEKREQEVRRFVRELRGEILQPGSDELSADFVRLPDSFTARVRLTGDGLRDLVLNFPYVFEVQEAEPIEIDLPVDPVPGIDDPPTIFSPLGNAPAVCVIDSGIQEKHPLLDGAIDEETSRCFLPGESPSDVADYYQPTGHGTAVAGAILYGPEVPSGGTILADYWIQNARVLNADCGMPENLHPAVATRRAVKHFHEGPRRTRIFNQSINTRNPCKLQHMSTWSAEIDLLSYENDILIVQSAGNIPLDDDSDNQCLRHCVQRGQTYPRFLLNPGSRIANPAQSLHALTVGSVARGMFELSEWRTFAQRPGDASAFSRTGFGLWESIKPDVVEFGGDAVVARDNPGEVRHGGLVPECCPMLVRSTFGGPGPLASRERSGTSFSTPLVTRIAAEIQSVIPDASAQLTRALIVQSARWPEESWFLDETRKCELMRRIGFGIPDVQRATRNTPHRATYITAEDCWIKAKDAHLYQVPIPQQVRASGSQHKVLIEITLAFVARPRRTCRTMRRYLSTWVDWEASKLGEPLASFRGQVFEGTRTVREGDPIPWMLGAATTHATIRGTSRKKGSVQKDWAVVESHALPESFYIAVKGHEGWDNDPEAAARYALVASFEVVDQQIEIYEAMAEAAVQHEIGVENSVDAQIIEMGPL